MKKERLFKSIAPELLQDLAAHAAKTATEVLGVELEAAEVLGEELAIRIAEVWGGQVVYFPTGKNLAAAKTHRAIFEEFNGINHHELSSKYKISVPHIYVIIKRERKLLQKKVQPDFFKD